ncbi:MAG: hypothetical protein ACI9WT_001252 [Flavobacterium sp.]|jgi:hypothetical protein
MKKNMGLIDKVIRSIVAAVIALLYFTNVISGTLALILGAFAIIFLITSFVSFCPLYAPFGISTRGKNNSAIKK